MAVAARSASGFSLHDKLEAGGVSPFHLCMKRICLWQDHTCILPRCKHSLLGRLLFGLIYYDVSMSIYEKALCTSRNRFNIHRYVIYTQRANGNRITQFLTSHSLARRMHIYPASRTLQAVFPDGSFNARNNAFFLLSLALLIYGPCTMVGFLSSYK